ncbi:hypothetical protein Ddc_08305 [Ditylenchus destructor]|nr:hypothetical protein Ddc_08305 [Ditylenchus destructor]
MYRMLRSRTIDNSNGSSDSPARARVAGAGARKSSAGTNQQNQKKMSVPGSPTKNRPGPAQSKKYSIGATMVTSPLVASSGPPIALPKAPYSGSVDITSGTQTPASPAAASLKKQRWSFAFRKRWFSSSVSTNSSCNSPVLARAAKVSVGSQGSDIRRQSEGSYTHEASTSVDPGASTSAAPPPSAGGGVQKRTSLRQPNTEITNKVSAASPLKQKGHIHRLEVNRSVIRDEQPILDSKINFRDPARNPNGRTLCDNDGINEEDEALQHKGGVQQPISLAV